MPDPHSVAVIVGSLRKASLSRLTAKALKGLAPPSLRLDIVEIGDLPLYNQDLEANPPDAWTKFREAVARADAVLFVTPEYNRSIPAPLKNAIDIGSRPGGAGAFNHKPAGVFAVSPGPLGGFGANHHLRQCLVSLDMPTLLQPEAYVGGIGTAFGSEGQLEDEGKRAFFTKFIQAYAAWLEGILAR